jgi:uncharacterized protein
MSLQPPRDLVAKAERGDAEAQSDLGRFYAERVGGAGARKSASMWFTRSAEQGFARAQHNLGVMAVQDDRLEEAQRWFQAASDQGWLNSTYTLGVLHLEAGRNSEASKLFDKAARQGHADAQDALANMFFKLKSDEAYKVARQWSELAAEQGLASAEVRLATIYHEGLGVERDPPRAAAYFLSAAKKGHPNAQFMMGVAYEVGAGVAVDLMESGYWLTQAAGAGNDVAEHYLMTRVVPRLSVKQQKALEARIMAGVKAVKSSGGFWRRLFGGGARNE